MWMYGGIGAVMMGAIGVVFWGLSAADGISRKNARRQYGTTGAGTNYDDGGSWGFDGAGDLLGGIGDDD